MLLKQQGWYQRDIGHALGVSEETVSRWLARARDGGPAALRARPRSGHPPKLSATQKRLIPEFLWHGPEAYGFRGEVWTCARIAWVIAEEFGVRYHKDHVGRLLKELHWTPQIPIRRAIQRDEEAIVHWRDAVWLLKGGGMIVRGVHPPARKFNAGQKLLFWLTAICGVMLAISGMVLQAPSTAAWLLDELSPALPGWFRAEMAADGTTYAVQWHGALALVLICAVMVHIYFRTIGIQGAASAMISGEVDANWARQHHRLWAEPEVERIEASANPRSWFA